ncbi:hypothetical protein AB4Y63_03755 [Leifsonia sp. YAF41]|uniref:hypothetical protein n=1 Tax=Leifsonia sp. YAF41 TaxID=3233086 RepID=UPI003F94E870
MSDRKRKLALPALMMLCLSAAATGCAGIPGGAPSSVPTSTSSVGASVTPSAGPTGTPTSAVPVPTASAAGCAPNGASVPVGATTATIEDVDGDDKPDVEFYSESPTFEYGIQTASGATFALADDLAGPGRHSGWSAPLESGVVVTVLDDSRTATLHAFVGCAFVTTKGVDGNPYRFTLNGFGDYGTGVQCSNGNGGRQLLGVLATQQSDGLYDIARTVVNVSRDGLVATNGSLATGASGLAASDPQVVLALTSRCGDIPKVQTSGR